MKKEKLNTEHFGAVVVLLAKVILVAILKQSKLKYSVTKAQLFKLRY